jgi:hypothetical protein
MYNQTPEETQAFFAQIMAKAPKYACELSLIML